MNKAPLFIIGSLSLAVIATAGWFVMNNNAQEKTLVTADLVANTNYFDTVEGDFKNASVTYTNLAPSFDEKTIPLKSSSIETDLQSKLIGYEIELANNKFISITLDKNKNLILTKYEGPLKNPSKKFHYYFELIKVKFFIIYLILINFKY